MRVHTLKTWPEYFTAVSERTKTFELRKDDRNFQVGDMLYLKEFEPSSETYTGRTLTRKISYKLCGDKKATFGVVRGFCVLGLK